MSTLIVPKDRLFADAKARYTQPQDRRRAVSDHYTPFSGSGCREQPAPVVIRECWRVIGTSGKPITCGFYEHPHGIEVRCQYSLEHLIRSQLAPDVDVAQDVAAAWKQAAIEKGFTEVKGVN